VWKVEKHRELAKRLEESLLKAPETDHIRLASASPRALKGRPPMRRTLLAVGFAVIVSMLLAPHGGYNKGRHAAIDGFGPFFMQSIPCWRAEYQQRTEYVNYSPGWATPPNVSIETIPAGWDAYNIGPVIIDMLALEIVFLAAVFAVAVNIRWRKRGNTGR
jgi:hypothetical protein